MNKKISISSLSIMILISFTVIAFAANDHSGQSRDKTNMQAEDSIIRHTIVDGYQLTYKLIDMREKMKAMGHDHTSQKMATHHLMLFIKSSDSQPVKNAKVGFLVKDAGDAKETTMAMAMGDGFGSDITLDKAGDYSIKVKAVTGENKIIDKFVYTLKK